MFESKESQQDLFQDVTKTVTIDLRDYNRLISCSQIVAQLSQLDPTLFSTNIGNIIVSARRLNLSA